MDRNVEKNLEVQLSLEAEREPIPEDFQNASRQPLYFALTRTIGTNVEAVIDSLSSELEKAGYLVRAIRLSDLIARSYGEAFGVDLSADGDGVKDFKQYIRLMRAGDILRDGLGASMASKLAILEINAGRYSDSEDAVLSYKKGVAYVITHLMHPDEVLALRSAYGQRFFLIAVNAPRKDRKAYLFGSLKGSRKSEIRINTDTHADFGKLDRPGEDDVNNTAEKVDRLIRIDAGIVSSIPYLKPKDRLNVDESFQHADLYIRSRAKNLDHGSRSREEHSIDEQAKESVRRFVRQIFSYPWGTPTDDETAMAAAFTASRSSVSLGRSVGAALVSANGEIVATGWNEVAKPGGGPYREADDPDHRDHQGGVDPSDQSRAHALLSFLSVLFDFSSWEQNVATIESEFPATANWLRDLKDRVGDSSLIPSLDIIRGLAAVESFDQTRLMHLIEFGRSTHAEIAAISDAARRSINTSKTRLFVTTFPCHECARGIVSFGIAKVFYVEPYGKSMAESLYSTEISVFEGGAKLLGDKRISFEPFEGIAPSALSELFSSVRRKNGLRDGKEISSIGSKVSWDITSAPLRAEFLMYPPGEDGMSVNAELEAAFLGRETLVAREISSAIRRLALTFRDPDLGGSAKMIVEP